MSAVMRSCMDILCSALGVVVDLDRDFRPVRGSHVKLAIRQPGDVFPPLQLQLTPLMLCWNTQLSLVLTTLSDLGVLLSVDSNSKVVSVYVFRQNISVIQKIQPSMSLPQVYDLLKSSIVKAFYLNNGSWVSLNLR